MPLIGQYQQGTFTTPVNGDTNDASVVVANDNATKTKHNSHDNDATIHVQSSSLAARPAVGTAGRTWITSDGLRVYYDTGAAWSEVAYLPTVGGAVVGNVSITGTLTGLTGITSSGTAALGAVTAAGVVSASGASVSGASAGDVALLKTGSLRIARSDNSASTAVVSGDGTDNITFGSQVVSVFIQSGNLPSATTKYLVTAGAADSGGVGYRVLRIPN